MARWLLPEGISDVLPQEARRLEQMRRTLLDLFAHWGYELVIPPLIEYVDSLLTGAGADLDLRTFKLIDQMSGRMMGLRADTTPQVARIDAHILNRSGVVRLCYASHVLHARPLHPLAPREPFQVGAELYGHAGLSADTEVLRLAAQALAAIGVSGARFDLGHTGVLRALLAGDAVAAARTDDIVVALSSKDGAALDTASEGLSAAAQRGLRALLRLHGSVEVLGQARRDLPALPEISTALDELEELAGQAGVDGLCVDLADLHGYRYHTGVTFAAYLPGLPGPLARGGRYDDIGRAFGRARPATGFSIFLRDLTRSETNGTSRAILAPPITDASLAAFITSLRDAGQTVVQQLADGDVPASHRFDHEIRQVVGTWQVVPRGT
ncbi:MAG: ATP phosphoribosyltransferase regulatory subunit [Gemmatimonadota bacterium]